MKIRSLTLENFRGFESASLDLDRPLTVLFGVNGAGKSSVLAACAMALSRVLVEVNARSVAAGKSVVWHHYNEDGDVRRGAEHLTVKATLANGDVVAEVVVRHPSSATRLGILNVAFDRLHHAAPSVASYYAASRDVAPARDAFAPETHGKEGPPRHDDSMVAGELRFRSFFQWFRAREDAENELKVARRDLSLEDPQLGAVRRAIAGILPGYSGLRIQRDPLHMVIRKQEELLLLDQLSDGERLLLVLAADLARRLATAYPQAGDPLQGEGVVLIDEVELHLHPSWQRKVLPALRATFPNCQLIVTTHSPQVLSEVPNDAVVLVDDFQFVRPAAPTAGRDSNAILAEVMETPERPANQLHAIQAISALLDEGKHSEARSRLDALAEQLSEQDREVVGLRTMLHFLEGEDEAHPHLTAWAPRETRAREGRRRVRSLRS